MHISVLILFMIIPQLIINTYVSLMYELKKIGKVFTSKFVGTGPSSYKKNNLPGRGLTKVEKYCAIPLLPLWVFKVCFGVNLNFNFSCTSMTRIQVDRPVEKGS
jgi:hypothetical protein